MRETTEPQFIPAQPQRWWVDYLHTVAGGLFPDLVGWMFPPRPTAAGETKGWMK